MKQTICIFEIHFFQYTASHLNAAKCLFVIFGPLLSYNNYRLCCVIKNTEIWLADTRNKVTFMFV